jgi:hypothetical protein
MPRRWVPSGHIKNIPGAHKPLTYVARAANHYKEHGEFPPWARKAEKRDPSLGVRRGDWIFDSSHIESEASDNLKYVSPNEIKKALKISRRTALNLIDAGHFGEVKKVGAQGERRVLRSDFERTKPELVKRFSGAQLPSQARIKKRAGGSPDNRPPSGGEKPGQQSRSRGRSRKRPKAAKRRPEDNPLVKLLMKHAPPEPEPGERRRVLKHSSVRRAFDEINPDNSGDVLGAVTKDLHQAGFSQSAISAARRELIRELLSDSKIDEDLVNFDAGSYSNKFMYSEALRFRSQLSDSVLNGEQATGEALREYQKFLKRSGLPEYARDELEDELKDDLGVRD